MKDKISVTVSRKYVVWIDSQIKTMRFRNRSHAVEYALAKLLEQEGEKTVHDSRAETFEKRDLRREGQPESISSRERSYF